MSANLREIMVVSQQQQVQLAVSSGSWQHEGVA